MEAGRAVGFAGFLVGSCLLVAAACSCSSGGSGGESATDQRAAKQAEEALAKARVDSAEFARLQARALERERDKAADAAKLPVLKKRFVFRPDEIRGGGSYWHVNQAPDYLRNHCCLHAAVGSSGNCYLATHYAGDDWIFHTKLTVRIRDQVMESAEVPTYSKMNMQHNSGGTVWESILLVDGSDNGILSAIAEADNSVPIVVRFEGDQHQKTFRLADRDRAAIKDSYELARILEGRPRRGL